MDGGVAFTNLLTCLDSRCLLTDDLLDSLANNLVTWEGHAFLTLLRSRSRGSNIICWLIATMSECWEGRLNSASKTFQPKIINSKKTDQKFNRCPSCCCCTVVIEKRCSFI
ncbi:hypothetical protein NPIL_356141 [Nephila pilipes]|uniref:Uncharacterized protein n=1 Tax=Nephila pilipes TaxID=299642 RepID=A0A8X6QLB3_NEPPI|nr:hypothetical protein NPIL_356141 [Nephila pilipes]